MDSVRMIFLDTRFGGCTGGFCTVDKFKQNVQRFYGWILYE